ncbi:MAG: trypsin-like peptidase domain-containing protein [Magnetovibrio sp.]|nr:trypsin-like peptidase domain-containing protein [Magnetovibrio sp.]
MRKIDRILLGIVFLAVFWRLADQALFTVDRAPVRQPVAAYAALDAQVGAVRISLPDAQIATSQLRKNSAYTGSAFALSNSGYWGTATHVTNGCKRLVLLHEQKSGSYRRILVAGWRALKGTDVAIIDSEGGKPGLPLAKALVGKGERGFFFGYPQGNPSAGYATNIGRTRMVRFKGREKEPADVWAITQMVPGNKIILGGNSGGPMLNEDGEVVGVVSAGNDRRGRMFTSIVANLGGLQSFSQPQHRSGPKLRPSNYADYGQQLRLEGLVTKVSCRT